MFKTANMASSKRIADDETIYLLMNREDQKLETIFSAPLCASRTRKIVVLVSCMLLHVVTGGFSYGLSVMYAELIVVFNAKRSDAALMQSIFYGITIGAGILWTGVIRRFGPGRCIILSTIFAAIALFLCSFALHLATVIILTGVVAGVSMSLIYLSGFIAVTSIFHTDAKIPLMCLTIGPSVGQFVLPVLFEVFISNYAWSGAYIILSGVALHCIPLGIIIHVSRRYFITGHNQKSSTGFKPFCDRALITDYVFWIILIDFHLLALTGNVEGYFVVDLLVSRGFTREMGSILASGIGLASLFGRILGGIARLKCKSIPTLYHWIYLGPILASSHVLIVNFNDYGLIFAACLFYGALFGVLTAQGPAIVFEYTGVELYPLGMALVNAMFGVGYFVCGYVGGYIMDIFGNYDLVFYIATGACFYVGIGSAMAAFLIRQRSKRSGKCKE